MAKNRSVKKILIIVLVSGAILYILNKGYKAINSLNASRAEDLPITTSMIKEDSELIQNKYNNRIKVIEVRNSRVRNPISQLMFDSAYFIFIYNLDTTGKAKIDTILCNRFGTYLPVGITYNILGGYFYDFYYKAGNPGPPSSLFVTVGSNTCEKIMKNDSIIAYYSRSDNLSIKFRKDSPIDIYIRTKTTAFEHYQIPMNFMILKRGKNSFFLMMAPMKTGVGIPKDLLIKLVIGD
jgi:hypothetical protein